MLIIDDSETLAGLPVDFFEKRGWLVVTCGNRDCAMGRLAGSEPYNVVLLGDRVPEADGVQLVRFIRALEHRLTAAIVMVTGNREVIEEAKAAGVDEVLLKPFNTNALVQAVDKQIQ